MAGWLGCLAALLLSVGLAGSSVTPLQAPFDAPTTRALPNDAYVWQRRWTPAVAAALHGTAGRIDTWRVLAAQARAGGHLQATAPDTHALHATGRPVVLVVRVDGRLP